MFSLILLTWIGFCVVVGFAASARGRDGLLWYVIAALISPPIAGITVLVMQNLKGSAPSANKMPTWFGVISVIVSTLLAPGLISLSLLFIGCTFFHDCL
jgi:hypothetical protein